MKEIQLTQGKVALVDDEDYEKLKNFHWQSILCDGIWYARRGDWKTKKTIYMHREIMGFPDFMIDHVDGCGLNNQKYNLRECDNSRNQRNSKIRKTNVSGYKGVSFNENLQKYYARIQINGKQKNLGYFDNAVDAAMEYDRVAINEFGEFARLNFPISF